MATLDLKAAKRHIEGKKVSALRREGVTPAHLFGPKVESQTIQVDTATLKRALVEAGHTGLINLHLGHEKSPRTVMVREVQIDTFKGELLHVDFYQVLLTENIKVDVPLVLVGESAAAKTKGNTLVQELNQLTIQCLPGNIPSTISVDVAPLVTADQMVRVRDLQIGKDIQVINDPDVVVARIAVEIVERVEEKPKAEGEEEAEEAVEGEEAEAKKEPTEKAEKSEKSDRKEKA